MALNASPPAPHKGAIQLAPRRCLLQPPTWFTALRFRPTNPPLEVCFVIIFTHLIAAVQPCYFKCF